MSATIVENAPSTSPASPSSHAGGVTDAKALAPVGPPGGEASATITATAASAPSQDIGSHGVESVSVASALGDAGGGGGGDAAVDPLFSPRKRGRPLGSKNNSKWENEPIASDMKLRSHPEKDTPRKLSPSDVKKMKRETAREYAPLRATGRMMAATLVQMQSAADALEGEVQITQRLLAAESQLLQRLIGLPPPAAAAAVECQLDRSDPKRDTHESETATATQKTPAGRSKRKAPPSSKKK